MCKPCLWHLTPLDHEVTITPQVKLQFQRDTGPVGEKKLLCPVLIFIVCACKMYNLNKKLVVQHCAKPRSLKSLTTYFNIGLQHIVPNAQWCTKTKQTQKHRFCQTTMALKTQIDSMLRFVIQHAQTVHSQNFQTTVDINPRNSEPKS